MEGDEKECPDYGRGGSGHHAVEKARYYQNDASDTLTGRTVAHKSQQFAYYGADESEVKAGKGKYV